MSISYRDWGGLQRRLNPHRMGSGGVARENRMSQEKATRGVARKRGTGIDHRDGAGGIEQRVKVVGIAGGTGTEGEDGRFV
jgi:hypothetical protein